MAAANAAEVMALEIHTAELAAWRQRGRRRQMAAEGNEEREAGGFSGGVGVLGLGDSAAHSSVPGDHRRPRLDDGGIAGGQDDARQVRGNAFWPSRTQSYASEFFSMVQTFAGGSEGEADGRVIVVAVPQCGLIRSRD